MIRIVLTLLFLLCIPVSLYADLYIAASNSPDRCKQRADVVCSGRSTDNELQAACDLASTSRDVLVMATGKYLISDTLRVRCAVRGEGEVRLAWKGGDDGKWMVIVEGTSIRSRNISGLLLCGAYRAKGMLVKDVHRATISDVHLLGTKGGGFRFEDAWCLSAYNLSCCWGKGPVFETDGFARSVLEGFTSVHMTSDVPLFSVSSGCDLRQLAIQRCDTGKAPVILLDGFLRGKLSGLHLEQMKGSSIVHVKDTKGAIVEVVNGGIRGPVGILVTGSSGVQVNQIWSWGISKALVWFDTYSAEHECSHKDVHEVRARGMGIEAKHLWVYGGDPSGSGEE